jgi:hypothetical protein
MPLWFGVFLIGLIEFGMGHMYMEMGFSISVLYIFNAVWFAGLFVPSLFYNPNFRKGLMIVYTVTTILNLLGWIGENVSFMMMDEGDKKVYQSEILGMAGGAGPMGGDYAATGLVWSWWIRDGMAQKWNMPDDADAGEYTQSAIDTARMMMMIEMLVARVLLRGFFNFVLLKFAHEGVWLKSNADAEGSEASHPCRPTMCCQGCMK